MQIAKRINKAAIILISLFVLFISPGLIAIYAYQHPENVAAKLTNHGTFIKPPILVSFLEESKLWHLVLYEIAECDTKCMNRIDEIARIRLSLGRKLYQIDFDVWLDRAVSDLTAEAKQTLKSINVNYKKMTCDDEYLLSKLAKESKIYLIAPGGQIMMQYPTDIQPRALFQDLKVVLGH